jgi:hypothetical protein
VAEISGEVGCVEIMETRARVIFVSLALAVAGYELLALLLFARTLSALIRQRRAAERSVKGPAQAN